MLRWIISGPAERFINIFFLFSRGHENCGLPKLWTAIAANDSSVYCHLVCCRTRPTAPWYTIERFEQITASRARIISAVHVLLAGSTTGGGGGGRHTLVLYDRVTTEHTEIVRCCWKLKFARVFLHRNSHCSNTCMPSNSCILAGFCYSMLLFRMVVFLFVHIFFLFSVFGGFFFGQKLFHVRSW